MKNKPSVGRTQKKQRISAKASSYRSNVAPEAEQISDSIEDKPLSALLTKRKRAFVKASSPDTTSDDDFVPLSSKRPMRQRKKDSLRVLTPGNKDDTKTFAGKIWEQEGLCVGYLGFRDCADLRRFAMSPWTLKYFNQLAPDRQAARLRWVLEALRDRADDMENDGNPASVYPRDHETNVNLRVALIVAQATREIENARSKGLRLTQGDVEKHCSAFDKIMGKKAPRLHASKAKLRFPDFGPFPKLGECGLERFARVFCLLKYVAYSAATPWESRFGSQTWDAESTVTESHIPHWMRPKKPIAPSPSLSPSIESIKQENPGKPVLEMRISWRYESALPEPTAYRTYISKEKPELEDIFPSWERKVRIESDTDENQFKNSVRELFNLEKLHAEIFSLRLVVQDAQGSNRQNFNLADAKWSDVQEALWGGKYDLEKSAFFMTVCRTDNTEVIWID